MRTESFRRVTRELKQILPAGQEGDSSAIQGFVFELIPANSMGYIKVQGILWRARCPQPVSLEPGTWVRVLDRRSLTLIVEPIHRRIPSFNLTAQTKPYIDG